MEKSSEDAASNQGPLIEIKLAHSLAKAFRRNNPPPGYYGFTQGQSKNRLSLIALNVSLRCLPTLQRQASLLDQVFFSVDSVT